MAKITDDPGPLPDDATPQQKERHRRAEERFLTENFKEGASQVPAKVDSTDARLQRLRREASAFMELHSPMKASIWLALQRPVADLISDVEQTRRFAAGQRGTGRGAASKAPRHSAIVEIGQRLVAAGIEGDMAALSMIADRIEGKAGLRKGDEDPNDAERIKKSESLQKRLVELMTERAVANKPRDDQVIDVEVVEVKPDVQ